MKKLKLLIILGLFFPIIAIGQTIPQLDKWSLTSGFLNPRDSSWGIKIPSLGSSGSPCLIVSSNGTISTSTCGESLPQPLATTSSPTFSNLYLNGYLFGTNTNQKIDMNGGIIFNSDGLGNYKQSVNWGGGVLSDSNEKQSVHWTDRYLKDPTEINAIDWNSATEIKFTQYTSNALLKTVNSNGTISVATPGVDYVLSGGALIDGSILFADGAGQVSQSNDYLKWDEGNKRLRFGNSTLLTSSETKGEYFSLGFFNTGSNEYKEAIRMYAEEFNTWKLYQKIDASEAINFRFPFGTQADVTQQGEIKFVPDFYAANSGALIFYDADVHSVTTRQIPLVADITPTAGQYLVWSGTDNVAQWQNFNFPSIYNRVVYINGSGAPAGTNEFEYREDLDALILGDQAGGYGNSHLILNKPVVMTDDVLQRVGIYLGTKYTYTHPTTSKDYYGYALRAELAASSQQSNWLLYDSQPVLSTNLSGSLVHFRLIEATGSGTVPLSTVAEIRQATKGSTTNITLLLGSVASPTAGNWNIYTDSYYQNNLLGNLRIGTKTVPFSKLHIGGDTTNNQKASPTSTGAWFNVDAMTLMDTSASSTNTKGIFNAFNIPTYSATTSVVRTVTDAANVYIAGAVTQGTNTTLTNSYSLWIDAGNARFDGNLSVGTGAAPVTNLDVGGFINWSGTKRVTSNFLSTATTTLANITGLSVTLTAGKTYQFEANLFVTAHAVGGTKYAMGGTATATNIIYNVDLIDNSTNLFTITSKQTALGGSVGQAGTTDGLATIKGLITVNAGGTLTVQFAENVASGTGTVLQGSYLVVHEIQ